MWGKHIHNVNINRRMNNNFLGMLVIPEEKTSLWRMYIVPRNMHTLFKKKNLLLPSTERRTSVISPSLFPNTHRERLCTLGNTAYNTQRFVPNKTSGSLVPLRDGEGRWRQAMELALLWGNHPQRGTSNHDITGAPGTDSCVLTCQCQKVKFGVSAQPQSSHRCRFIYSGMCFNGDR